MEYVGYLLAIDQKKSIDTVGSNKDTNTRPLSSVKCNVKIKFLHDTLM